MRKIAGAALIIIAIAIIVTVLYNNSQFATTTRTFSTNALLNSSWDSYKKQFVNNDGRVIDYSQNSITTSEGQSYAMLQAVWIDDKATFDLVWHWTNSTLKRPADHLFGWQWGQRSDGTYGFMPQGGDNAAADADSDIALALIFASRRWGDATYQTAALAILNDLWTKETNVILGKRYLIAGNWAAAPDRDIINPSYFAPYAWKVFAQVDHSHNWNSLVAPAYDLLETATQSPLNTTQSALLPPDWISVSKQTGQVGPPNVANYTTNYAYDAMRVPWRIALDYYWFHDPQAKQYLTQNFGPLAQTFQTRGQLAGSYTHDGKAIGNYEDPAMYATALAYFMVTNPSLAKQDYDTKIIKLYSNATNSFNDKLTYYQQNWLWFGAALYNQQLVLYQ